MPQQYIIPEWMRESMSAEDLARLEGAATTAAFKAASDDLGRVATAAGGIQAAVEGGHKDTLVALLTAARDSATAALYKLGATPVVVSQRPATGAKPAGGGTATPLSPEKQAARDRSEAAWYFIRNAGAGRYSTPGEMKAKNPEEYRTLLTEALELYDAGKLSASGKRIA